MAALQHTPIVLTGIKPAGQPHPGSIDLARRHPAFYLVADGHALITVRHPELLARRIDEVSATWLALGLNPAQAVFYRQSAVPETFEQMWILARDGGQMPTTMAERVAAGRSATAARHLQGP